MFLKVKGVVDNLCDMAYWNGVQKKIEAHLQRYNFSKIEVPTLEHVSLFQRGLGLETDVVSKQMFIIASKNSSDTDPLCLRPEATAGTMRAFLEKQATLSTPFKVYSYGSMFRYERPQKGRLREFHQMNLEIIGADSNMHDVLLIKMLHTLFAEELNLTNFVLKLNYLGTTQDRQAYVQALTEFLNPQQATLCDTCIIRLKTNVLRILDCKSEECQKLIFHAPTIDDFFSENTKQEWQTLQQTLEILSVNFIHDKQLVRGLDYYNKTVFEFVSTDLGAQNSFCGGGRYDGLAQQLDSKKEVPALGCAIGMERLLLILEPQKNTLSEPKLPLIVVIPCEAAQQNLALFMADNLQAQGKCVDIVFEGSSLKSKMKKANTLGAAYVLLLGQEEQQTNTVTIKNMTTGIEEKVLQIDAYRHV